MIVVRISVLHILCFASYLKNPLRLSYFQLEQIVLKSEASPYSEKNSMMFKVFPAMLLSKGGFNLQNPKQKPEISVLYKLSYFSLFSKFNLFNLFIIYITNSFNFINKLKYFLTSFKKSKFILLII